ncbi:hypothetical protein HPP92_026800 [Vanilla planifolia]|uniref:NAB domain-containing protein n=1 Tax=Vanilla planifolia TaxID=51239 RepID=A0A835PI26_VANPL|nr:hypothetical protein HPP92_026800 [Vanilla planifolia]
MDRLVSEMLKLIEADGDSFAKKAQMYYLRRPELISHVEDFYRMYRSLAERYNNATIELSKNGSTELQSQSSVISIELGTDVTSASLPSSPHRTSEHKPSHFKPCSRAAGFDFFLGSGGNSDRSRKISDESSSESSSDSDYCKLIYAYENYNLEARIIELENELREAKDKLREDRNGFKEQCELLLNMEDLDLSSTKLMANQGVLAVNNFNALAKHIEEMEVDIPDFKGEFEQLKEEMKAAVEQFELEISRRDHAIREYKMWLDAIMNKCVQDDSSLESEQKSSIAAVKADEEEVIQDKSAPEIKTLERVQMIRHMVTMGRQPSNRTLQKEKSLVEAQLSSLMASINCYEIKLQVLEERIKQLEAEKSNEYTESEKRITELEDEIFEFKVTINTLTAEKEELSAQVSKLENDAKAREDESSKFEDHPYKWHEEHNKLTQQVKDAQKASISLTFRVEELEEKVHNQELLIMDSAEEKREAIRQLCFSLEHYRVGYLQLRQMLQMQHRRPAVMVT